MKGKMGKSSGTVVELVESIDEVTKSDNIGKLKFTKKYISSFAAQL